MFTDEDVRLAIEAEEQHERMARCIHLPDGTAVITHEFDSVLYFDKLMRVAKRVGYGTEPVSRLVKCRSGGFVARLTTAGQHLQSTCRGYKSACYVWSGRSEQSRFSNHKFHPVLDAMLKAVASAHEQVNDASSFHDQELLHRSVTALAETIRGAFSAPEFKKQVRNYQRNAELKLRRALRYLLSLFRQHSRLLILRVDLYVREDARGWSYSADADLAFDNFSEALGDSKIVPNVLGWMSAREDGVERGQHYHVLVAVDGHKHRAGANLTRMLGEYWAKECVGEEQVGTYFNCFALVHKYKHLGIGLIHCTDAKKLLGLFYATRYLCKDEVQLIATGDRTRNFRRGQEIKEFVRLGAPRRYGEDLSLARAVLFGQLRPVKARRKKEPALPVADQTPESMPTTAIQPSSRMSDGGRDAPIF